MQDKPKLVGLELTGDGRIGNQVVMDLDEPEEYIEIPLYSNKEEEKEGIDLAQENMRIQNEKQWYK